MKNLFIALLLIFSGVHVYAQAPALSVAVPQKDAAAVRLEAFDKVWRTVNDNHYDPTFGGVDWARVRADYLPHARAAKSNEELHAVLREMLGELKLSHFGIHQKPPATPKAGKGGVGIDIRMLNGKAMVFRVEKDSPAGIQGIRPGYLISKIDGKTVGELLRPLNESFRSRSLTAGVMETYRERTLEALLSGAPNSEVAITVLNETDRSSTVRLKRKAYSGQMSEPLGHFPAQEMAFESKLLPENIGYVRFNIWVIPQMPKIREAVRTFAGAKGIIFDLRGNPGGVGGMASGVAGLLAEERGSLGSMKSRGGKMEFIVYPQPGPFTGPVVVLTDHGSASTSEVFAAGLQESGRAAVIGTTTAGAVLPSVFVELPTGALFQYAVSDYRSPRNILIEGRGVIPDKRVALDRKVLLSGRDPQLDAAVKHILN